MFQYHCLNPIAEKGLGLFDEEYKKTVIYRVIHEKTDYLKLLED